MNEAIFFNCHRFIERTSQGSNFWGAFWGAFFAFVFGLITYIITKKREGFIQHKNALVKLEYLLNVKLGEVGDVKQQAERVKEILKVGHLTHSRFPMFNLPESFEMELRSLDIINQYLSYSTLIRKYNSDAASVNHALSRFEDVLINRPPLTKDNLDFAVQTLDEFDKFFNYFIEKTKELLVKTRLYVEKTKDKNSFFYGVVNTNFEFHLTSEEMKAEKEKLNGEIKVIKEDEEGQMSQYF